MRCRWPVSANPKRPHNASPTKSAGSEPGLTAPASTQRAMTGAAVVRARIAASSTAARLGWLGWMSIITAAFVLAPILAVVWNVFLPSEITWPHLISTVLPGYIWNTLLLVLMVAAGVILCGALSAWIVTAYSFPGQRVLEWALVLPLAMPAYVMAYAYTDWLQAAGPVQTMLRDLTGLKVREYWFPEIRSLPGAAAMLSFALYPYVYLLARAAFLDQSRTTMDAARLAGYGGWGRFFRVALPLARPGIVAGTALALMEALADFGTVSYFAVQTFTTGIYRAWLSLGDTVAAGQLASCLLAFVALVLVAERVSRGKARYHNVSARARAVPQRLHGFAAAAAFVACFAPLLFGFLLPVGILTKLAWDEGAIPSARLVSLMGNTFTLAGITAVLAIVAATLMAYAGRVVRSPVVATANRIAALGYAIPGAVIAVGILVPLGKLDNALAQWLQQH